MNKDNTWPAFPQTMQSWCKDSPGHNYTPVPSGMTLGDYACIKLLQPVTGRPWLDDLIRKRQRDEFAGQALRAWIMALADRHDQPGYHDDDVHGYAARYALKSADAMLAEREKKE